MNLNSKFNNTKNQSLTPFGHHTYNKITSDYNQLLNYNSLSLYNSVTEINGFSSNLVLNSLSVLSDDGFDDPIGKWNKSSN